MATGRPNGRPPKPVEQRAGHRSKKENETISNNLASFEIPEPFKPLNAKEKILWNYIWTGGQKYLNPKRDVWVVQTTVMLWADWLTEMATLKKEGYVIEVVNGNGFSSFKRNERALVVKDLWQQLNTQISSLGFSPADAARLQLETSSDDKDTALKNLLTQKRS